MRARVAAAVLGVALGGCTLSGPDAEPLPAGAQCRSEVGEPLYPPPVAKDQRAGLEQQLLDARARWQAAPDDADALIWYGRRLGYLGQFREAVEVFTEGIQRHPEDALAGIRPAMDIVEYTSYHRLALAWKGQLDPDALLAAARQDAEGDIDLATVGFGVGNWHLCRGETELARGIFTEVVGGQSWQAFGHIAAEVELARTPPGR